MLLSHAVQEMNRLLDDLSKIDLGYPIGANEVHPAAKPELVSSTLPRAGGCARKWLVPLYAICNGLSFPDVHVGYFVKPIEGLASFEQSSDPDTVILDCDIPVLPIGSTGGGDLFVIRCDTGAVLLLPPGPVTDRQYKGNKTMVKEVAKSVSEFVDLLIGDLKAFVNDDRQHAYIA